MSALYDKTICGICLFVWMISAAGVSVSAIFLTIFAEAIAERNILSAAIMLFGAIFICAIIVSCLKTELQITARYSKRQSPRAG